MRELDSVILHCSDTPDGKEYTLEDINRWHKRRGFKDPNTGIPCGYHYLIYVTGKVVQGRPLGSVGAHTLGHNKRSIGICYIGREKMNAAQVASLCSLLKQLKKDYKGLKIYGHYEFDKKKTCPNQDMEVIKVLFGSL